MLKNLFNIYLSLCSLWQKNRYSAKGGKFGWLFMNPKWKKILIGEFSVKRLISSFVLIILVLLMFSFSCVDRMIFFPPTPGYADDDSLIRIESAPGNNIAAMYFPNDRAEYTILFSHGNAEDIGTNDQFFGMLVAHGFAVLAYDYRGYGHSQGKTSEKTTYQDIAAAYKYLTDTLKVPPGRIIVHGRSVGSAPSLYLATKEKFAGLIMEGPFTSAFRVVTRKRILPFDKFDNLARIDKIDCPLLIMAGEADNIVPSWHGKKLYEKANDPKMSLWVEGAGHNNFLWIAGQQYWDTLEEFENMIKEN
jgi:hypothetical protein